MLGANLHRKTTRLQIERPPQTPHSHLVGRSRQDGPDHVHDLDAEPSVARDERVGNAALVGNVRRDWN
jgi:hypothetical protein